MEVYTCDSESYVVYYSLAFLMLDLVTQLCLNGAFICLRDGTKKKKQSPQIIDFVGFVTRRHSFVAVRTGLEPVTPCVTGMYSNQLN